MTRALLAAFLAWTIGCSDSSGPPAGTGPDVLPKSYLVIVANVLSAPYPATGGSASILRTDLGGQAPFSVAIPNQQTEGYYVAVNVSPGTYAVTYTPPNGYTTPNPQADVLVILGGYSVVTFDVTP